MSDDFRDTFAELDAMKQIATALDGFDEDAVARMIRWQIDQYNVDVGGAKRSVGKGLKTDVRDEPDDVVFSEFDSAAELMATAQPKTDVEKVLVTAYWFQVLQNQSELESQSINTELKHQGHGIKNITSAFAGLINQKPQLVIQLRKGGNSRQARKKYKLTNEGVKRVRQMIASVDGNGDDD